VFHSMQHNGLAMKRCEIRVETLSICNTKKARHELLHLHLARNAL